MFWAVTDITIIFSKTYIFKERKTFLWVDKFTLQDHYNHRVLPPGFEDGQMLGIQ